MWFKLAKASFSTNLGLMSELSNSIVISYNATGFSYSMTSVSKDKTSASLVLTLKSNYEYTHATSNVTVSGATMGSVTYSNGTLTIPITYASTSSNINVAVTGAVFTGGSGGGEPETPVNPPSGAPTVVWTVNASLGAPDGKELTPQANRSRTNVIKVADLTGDITSGGVASRFIVSCYGSNGEYIGQINKTNINDDLVIGTGQWIAKGTLISKTLLISKGALTIRMVVDSQESGSTFIMGGQVIATTDGSGSETTTYNYPFVAGTITKENGENTSGSRVRTDEYFEQSKLGTKFTVNECRFIVACYTSDKKYLGQYNAATNILDDTCLTKATFNSAGVEVVTATIFSKQADILENKTNTGNKGTVAYVRFVGETPSSNPHLYVDGVKLTK